MAALLIRPHDSTVDAGTHHPTRVSRRASARTVTASPVPGDACGRHCGHALGVIERLARRVGCFDVPKTKDLWSS